MVPVPVKSCIMLTADVPPAAFSACVSNNTACGSRCGTWLSWVDGCWLPTDLTIRTKITEKTTKRDKCTEDLHSATARRILCMFMLVTLPVWLYWVDPDRSSTIDTRRCKSGKQLKMFSGNCLS